MINPKLMPSNTHWQGQAGNLLNGTGKTSQISFYGLIKKMPVSHTIQIIGTVVLRRNDGDLGSYYGGWAWDTIGTQPVWVDWIIEYTD